MKEIIPIWDLGIVFPHTFLQITKFSHMQFAFNIHVG